MKKFITNFLQSVWVIKIPLSVEFLQNASLETIERHTWSMNEKSILLNVQRLQIMNFNEKKTTFGLFYEGKQKQRETMSLINTGIFME
jgi:hypothetical protein